MDKSIKQNNSNNLKNIQDDNLSSVKDDLTSLDEDASNPINKFYLETITNLEKIKEDINKNISNVKKMYKIAIKYSKKQTKRSNLKTKNPSGFGKSTYVPDSLKKILNINENEMTRPKLTGKLYEYIDKNNLKSETNGRIMRVNQELASALKLSNEEIEKINNSTSDKDKSGLNFYTAQKWIKKLYEKELAGKNINTKSEVKPITKNNFDTKVKKNEQKQTSDSKSNNKLTTQVKPNTESNIQSKPNVKPNIESNVKPNIESNVKPNIESNVKPNIESNIESNVKPNVESNIKPIVEHTVEIKSTVEPRANFDFKSNGPVGYKEVRIVKQLREIKDDEEDLRRQRERDKKNDDDDIIIVTKQKKSKTKGI